jgi:hypothetical protein
MFIAVPAPLDNVETITTRVRPEYCMYDYNNYTLRVYVANVTKEHLVQGRIAELTLPI